MGYTLIITEKPKSAQKIAEALADAKAKKEASDSVPYYRVTHEGKELIVASAVGHLYSLTQKKGLKWSYPVFDVEWKPIADINKEAKYTKKYVKAITTLAKKASAFVVATDYDIEGEVIGLNCVRFACKQKDAKRMKFSTLTKPDLVKAFTKLSPTLDWGQANAGETRHILDWYYGINLSRALTDAIKAQGTFKIMSAGRVQGPALKLIVTKEKDIKAFVSKPFWQITLHSSKQEKPIVALHAENQFWEKTSAEKVYGRVRDQKKATVAKIKREQFRQSPPTPFDLTSLQVETYKVHKISPKETLAIAQELYIGGFISYPRTSSQKLPKEIGYDKILKDLALQQEYKDAAKFLLGKKTITPNEGKKEDPAHPAIYPTGIPPAGINEHEAKVYDLIVRRFLATFGDPAVREVADVIIMCNNEEFNANGIITKEKGWHTLYGKYAIFKEEDLPPLAEGEIIPVTTVEMTEKETQPPRRYTESSIIKELEKHNLGTKATRAQIIDTLYQRGYCAGKPAIEATEFGIKTCETLEKYCPAIVDEELTRHFEIEMENVRQFKASEDEVLAKARELLTKVINEFVPKKKEVGAGLLEAFKETREQAAHLGECPVCKNGALQLRRGKYGAFVACSGYPACTTTFSLPASGLIQPAKRLCDDCGYPVVRIIRKGKRPQEVCINQTCKSKTQESEQVASAVASGELEKKCPKCSKSLVLRKSIYGQFWGCSGYPACRHTERVTQKE
ncbi:DNA topoisomerase I [Candidatus Woesearchaeota archaeon]|nr:DNA topoisomerase I [Candidatus Woesearchaeota archaeon]